MCDSSASANLSEAEIDSRVNLLFELEDPSLVYDLRHHLAGRQAKFNIFLGTKLRSSFKKMLELLLMIEGTQQLYM